MGMGIGMVQYWRAGEIDRVMEKEQQVQSLERGIFELNALSNDVSSYPQDARPQQQWLEKYKSVHQELENISADNESQILILQDIHAVHDKLGTLYEKLGDGASDERVEGRAERRRQISGLLLVYMQQMLASTQRLSEMNRKQVNEVRRYSNELIFAMIIALTLLTGLFAYLIGRGITRPIKLLKDGTEVVAGGELGYRFGRLADNEIGELSESFDSMVNKLQQTMTSRDEMEVKVAERTRELSEAYKRLQELDRMKSIFLSSMSHEMRTPLNAIIGFTSLVEQGMAGKVNEEQMEHLHRSLAASRHLLQLVQEAIDVSEIEAGTIKPEVESVALADLAAEAMQEIRAKAEKKSLQLLIDAPEGLAIRTDRLRLRQCMVNLLSNAEKYSERGTITLSVCKGDGDTVTISVTDTGIGIGKEDAATLFTPFTRLDSPLRVVAGGTGLGLYITRRIVTGLLGGEIFLESVPGQGSTFGMRLPTAINPGLADTL